MSLYSRLYEKEGPGIDRNVPPPKGLRAFFLILGRNWKALITLNLVFLLHCLPIFTIGAAITALQEVALLLARDEPCSAVVDFRYAFRQNFRRYSLFGWISVVCTLLLVVALITYFRFSLIVPYWLPLFVFTLLAALVFGLCQSYMLSLCVVTALPLRLVLKNAFLLGAGCVRHSFCALVCELLLACSVLLFLPLSWFWLFGCLFSLSALIGAFSSWAGIERYVLLSSQN